MQKRHRTFIAINLPHEIKKKLARYQERWGSLPAKWVPEDNLHITLVFLGELTDIELGEACVAVKQVASQQSSFSMLFHKVAYGPDEKIPPKMIWVSGEKSLTFSELKRNLEDALLEKIHFSADQKNASPHITLARISTFLWRQIEPEERPEVYDDLNLEIPVDTIEVMESELKRGGPEYTVIESFDLGS